MSPTTLLGELGLVFGLVFGLVLGSLRYTTEFGMFMIVNQNYDRNNIYLLSNATRGTHHSSPTKATVESCVLQPI